MEAARVPTQGGIPKQLRAGMRKSLGIAAVELCGLDDAVHASCP